MRHLSDVERARRCFLLTLASRDPGGSVHRGYLAEKVETIYNTDSKDHIRNMLDGPSKVRFDNIWDESLAPVFP